MQLTLIGGGTGLSRLLESLKPLHVAPRLTLTAICTHGDDGGCTGTLVREYGEAGYIGDLMKCVLALCPQGMEEIVEEKNFRLSGGKYDGMVLRNFEFLALKRLRGLEEALQKTYERFRITPHRVLPAATSPSVLCAKLENGGGDAKILRGESHIAAFARSEEFDPRHQEIRQVFFDPPVVAYPPAVEAIQNAQAVVIAPGSFHTSIMAALAPKGIRAALSDPKIPVVLVLNLMRWERETRYHRAESFVADIEAAMGRPCDIVLANKNFSGAPRRVLDRYGLSKNEFHDYLVMPHSQEFMRDPRMIIESLRGYNEAGSVIHDPAALRRVFEEKILPKISVWSRRPGSEEALEVIAA